MACPRSHCEARPRRHRCCPAPATAPALAGAAAPPRGGAPCDGPGCAGSCAGHRQSRLSGGSARTAGRSAPGCPRSRPLGTVCAACICGTSAAGDGGRGRASGHVAARVVGAQGPPPRAGGPWAGGVVSTPQARIRMVASKSRGRSNLQGWFRSWPGAQQRTVPGGPQWGPQWGRAWNCVAHSPCLAATAPAATPTLLYPGVSLLGHPGTRQGLRGPGVTAHGFGLAALGSAGLPPVPGEPPSAGPKAPAPSCDMPYPRGAPEQGQGQGRGRGPGG